MSTKRILALILTLVMCFTVIAPSTIAFAEGEEQQTNGQNQEGALTPDAPKGTEEETEEKTEEETEEKTEGETEEKIEEIGNSENEQNNTPEANLEEGKGDEPSVDSVENKDRSIPTDNQNDNEKAGGNESGDVLGNTDENDDENSEKETKDNAEEEGEPVRGAKSATISAYFRIDGVDYLDGSTYYINDELTFRTLATYMVVNNGNNMQVGVSIRDGNLGFHDGDVTAFGLTSAVAVNGETTWVSDEVDWYISNSTGWFILDLYCADELLCSITVWLNKPASSAYTVTFDANGHGTAPEALTEVVSGSMIAVPTAPSDDGYIFTGWYTSEDGGVTLSSTPWDFANGTVTADITLYAGWVEAVAKIGENAYYANLAEAVEAAEDGDTVIVLKDITISSTITVNKIITLDATGKTVTIDMTGGTRGISVRDGGSLTIAGGTFTGIKGSTGNNGSLIDLAGGSLTVNAGSFTNANTCIGVTGGTANINYATMKALDGGTCVLAIGSGAVVNIRGLRFTCEAIDVHGPGCAWAQDGARINIYSGTYNANLLGEATIAGETTGANYCLYDYRDAVKYGFVRGYIKVYGGTFLAFNPADNYNQDSFLADGYVAIEDNNTWTVSKIPAAQVEGGEGFDSVEEAIAEVANDTPITVNEATTIAGEEVAAGSTVTTTSGTASNAGSGDAATTVTPKTVTIAKEGEQDKAVNVYVVAQGENSSVVTDAVDSSIKNENVEANDLVKVADVLATQVATNNAIDADKVTEIEISVKAETKGDAQENAITYEVDPYATIKQTGAVAQEVKLTNDDLADDAVFTFHLDVTAITAAVGDKVAATHKSGNTVYGTEIYEAQGNENARYIEITTDRFSEWDLTAVTAGAVAAVFDGSDAYVGSYASLAEAAAAAQNGDTVVMLADSVETAEPIFNVAGASYTLDLAGHTVDVSSVWDIFAKDGTLTLTSSIAGGRVYSSNGYGIYVSSSNNGEFHGALVIDSENVTVSAGGKAAIVVQKNGRLTVSAGTIINHSSGSGEKSGISGNGNMHNTEITITGGTITSAGTAIYHPQNGTLIVSGGTITGATGIYQKAGTLNVTGGTITGTLDPEHEYSYYGNGCIATGDAIVIDNCNYPGGAPSANIKGATLSSTKANQVGYYVYNNSDEGTVLADDDYTLSTNTTKGWVASSVAGYAYTIGTAVASITKGEPAVTTYYASLKDAVAAVPADGTATTITMIADSAEPALIEIPATKNIVLDLKGFTVSHVSELKSVYFIKNAGTLTIQDTSANHDGKITMQAVPDSGYSVENVTLYNCGGTVTLASGKVENTTNGGLTYAVNNSSNAWGKNDDKETVFNMTGGTVSAPNGDAALRVYQNCAQSATPFSHNTVNISGGTILDTGIFLDTYIYQPNENTTGSGIQTHVTISGGTINGLIDLKLRHGFNTSLDITGGDFTNAQIWVRKKANEWNANVAEPTEPIVSISGGKFSFAVGKAFGLAYDCAASEWTSYTQPYAVSGGVFNVDLNNFSGIQFPAGKTGVANTDGATSENYPYTVGNAPVAKIGDNYYASLKDAVTAVPTDGTKTTITMLVNHELSAGVTVAAGQNIVLELNGKEITESLSQSGTSALITNRGTLTIQDNTDTSKNGTGTGKISYYNATPDTLSNPGYASNTIINNGTLTIESGYIENTTTGGYAAYTIDNLTNGNLYTPVLTVNGGKLYNSYTDAIRMFLNSDSKLNTVVINGGVIDSDKASGRVIVMHDANVKANKGELDVTGGEIQGMINAWSAANSGGVEDQFSNAQIEAVAINITGGKIEKLDFSSMANTELRAQSLTVTGGYYNVDPTGYVAAGYEVITLDNTATDDDLAAYNAGFTYKVVEQRNVASVTIGGTTTNHTTLADAIAAANAAESPATITLLRDYDMETNEPGYGWTTLSHSARENFLDIGNNVTFDLNGKVLSNIFNNTFRIVGKNVTVQNGTMQVGTYTNGTTCSYVMLVEGASNFVVNDLTTYGGINVSASTAEINNLSFSGTTFYAVCSQDNAEVTLNGGTYNKAVPGAANYLFWVENGSTMNITGGTYIKGSAKFRNGSINPVITGGVFDFNPTDFGVAEGYEAVGIDNPEGYYQVGEIKATELAPQGEPTSTAATYQATRKVVDEDNQVIGGAEKTVTVNLSATGGAVGTNNSLAQYNLESIIEETLGASDETTLNVSIDIVSDDPEVDTSGATPTITYEVHPVATIKDSSNATLGTFEVTNEQLGADAIFTIKLPVPEQLRGTGFVKVTHRLSGGGEVVYSALAVVNGYVTIANVTEFSEFELEIVTVSAGSTDCGFTLALKNKIDMPFYVWNLQADASSYTIEATYTNAEGQQQHSIVTLSDDYKIADGWYRVVVASFSARQMADEVTVILKCGDETIYSNSYSIKKYCQSVISDSADEGLKELCKATLDYGRAAQLNFNYNTENIVIDEYYNDVAATTIGSQYEGGISTNLLSYAGATLSLKSQTDVNFYIQLRSGDSIDNFTFTVNNVVVTPTDVGSGFYRVIVPGFAAKDLDKPAQLTVEAVSGAEETLSYSVLNYAKSVVEGSEDDNLIMACKALYLYWAAANENFSN